MHRIIAGLVGVSMTIASAATAETVTCSFKAADKGYAGQCVIPCSVNALAVEFDGINPKRACAGPARSVQASITPAVGENWLGRMEGKEPEDPTRFELTKGKAGGADVAKLPFGWFAVAKSERAVDRWTLSLDAQRQVPPSADDLQILSRAKAMLASEAVWNREDNRQCPPGQAKVSCSEHCSWRRQK